MLLCPQLRRIFGAEVISAVDREDVAEAADRRRRGAATRGTAQQQQRRRPMKKALLVAVKDSWPPLEVGGLSMEFVGESPFVTRSRLGTQTHGVGAGWSAHLGRAWLQCARGGRCVACEVRLWHSEFGVWGWVDDAPPPACAGPKRHHGGLCFRTTCRTSPVLQSLRATSK